MRIWDVSPKTLCNKHLFGEHGELHAIFSILSGGKRGYSRHPEVKRWAGKQKALYLRHEKLAKEIQRRGYAHNSSLAKRQATGRAKQDIFIHTKAEQEIILKHKDCECPV